MENCSSCRCLEAFWVCTAFLSLFVFRSLAELFNQATDSGPQFPFDVFRFSMFLEFLNRFWHPRFRFRSTLFTSSLMLPTVMWLETCFCKTWTELCPLATKRIFIFSCNWLLKLFVELFGSGVLLYPRVIFPFVSEIEFRSVLFNGCFLSFSWRSLILRRNFNSSVFLCIFYH